MAHLTHFLLAGALLFLNAEATTAAARHTRADLAHAPTSKRPPSTALTGILKALRAGQVADLTPAKPRTVISHQVIEQLLTDGDLAAKIHRHGVVIKGAEITGDVDLVNATVPHEVWFQDCVFKGVVNLTHCTFKRSLSFEKCHLEKGAELRDGRVEWNIYFSGDSAAQINMSNCSIGGQCRFIAFNCDGGIRAQGITAKDDFRFEAGYVKGIFDLTAAVIGGSFEGLNAHFLHDPGKAGLANRSTNGLSAADFADPAQAAMQLNSWNSVKVGRHLILEDSELTGGTDFRNMDIAGNLQLSGTAFKDTRATGAALHPQLTSLRSSRIGATFRFSTIGQFATLLDLSGVTYQTMRADGAATASDDECLKLVVEKCGFSPDVYKTLETCFTNQGKANLADHLYVQRRQQERKRLSPLLQAVDFLFLDLLVLYGKQTWRVFFISALVVGYGSYLFRPGKGGRMFAKTDPVEANKDTTVIDAASAGNVTPTVSAPTETERATAPPSDAANDPSAVARRTTPTEHQTNFMAWLVSVVTKKKSQSAPATEPPANSQSQIWAAPSGFIDASAARDNSKWYSPCWYSLDTFLPAVDLGIADDWSPNPNWRFGRNYLRFHILFGWILVPIGIASLTGLLK